VARAGTDTIDGSATSIVLAQYSSVTLKVNGATDGYNSIAGRRGITASDAELNILDGVTSTTAELNILDGVTSTTAELNIMDGVTSTTAELNILDGVTSTTEELNYNDIAAAGTAQASKSVVLDSAKDITGLNDVAYGGQLTSSIADGTAPLVVISETEVANLNVEQHGGLRVKVVDIGDWDMDATATVNVNHGLTSTDIRSVGILIRSDVGTVYPITFHTLGNFVGGGYSLGSSQISISRLAGGQFDAIGFDSTSYNRGWVTIHYVP